MATSLFALLDDIATLLDDVSVLTKVAAQKTAGVLGDDLALNAQQVSGVAAERELPVVWAVAKGSMLNKLILVPAALLLSLTLPWLITPLLMLGGAYLCFEGFEKLAHALLHRGQADPAREAALMQALTDPAVDLVELEKDKIKGAIRTDFVLSAEIIAITLGTVQNSGWLTQLSVLAAVAGLMTVGVYGLVAGIVNLDDLGLYLSRLPQKAARQAWKQALGRWLLQAAPVLMKSLSVLGTAAMFLVGGGILAHGLPFLQQLTHLLDGTAAMLAGLLLDVVTGLVAGALVYVLLALYARLRSVFVQPGQ
ncbi:MAG: DUF808 domain-containing protein [Rhodoferax sp.]|nr:DUF808 domain-containing protein [Rhodoferax sp.]